MRLKQKLWTGAAAFWFLSSLAWAAPRVAIVTPLGGDVWLGGVRLTAPRLAEEGQELTVAAGGSARVQLLDSSKEKQVKGNAHLVISKTNLQREGRPLARGSIAVSQEIGSLSQAAASSGRPGSITDYYPIGFALELPPVPFDGGYKIQISTPLKQMDLSPEQTVSFTVTDLTNPNAPEMPMEIDTPTDSLDFPAGVLVEGHRYEVVVAGKGRGYTRFFQLRDAEEQTALAEAASRIVTTEEDRFAVLLRLANFYRGFDQTAELADVLREAVADPQYQLLEFEDQRAIALLLNDALRALDQATLELPKKQDEPIVEEG